MPYSTNRAPGVHQVQIRCIAPCNAQACVCWDPRISTHACFASGCGAAPGVSIGNACHALHALTLRKVLQKLAAGPGARACGCDAHGQKRRQQHHSEAPHADTLKLCDACGECMYVSWHCASTRTPFRRLRPIKPTLKCSRYRVGSECGSLLMRTSSLAHMSH